MAQVVAATPLIGPFFAYVAVVVNTGVRHLMLAAILFGSLMLGGA